MTSTPDNAVAESVPTRDSENPGIRADITAQPFGGDGHVFAQVGWLDEGGTTYPLRLPDTLPHGGASLRALYIGLGAYGQRAAEAEPCA